MLKLSNKSNDCYNFKTIYLSSYIIQALINFDTNNIFIGIFNKKDKKLNKYYKLFLLQIAISYRNIYFKLYKIIPLYNKNLFPLIFSEIFLAPLLHNFDKVFAKITKKIDLVLFGNSEYISSIAYDMDKKEVLYDTGYLVQKNYKFTSIDFSKKNKIMEEINFFGQKLKNNHLKSSDKNIDKIENCIKLELRATFPKPLFILRFFPILKGVLIIHIFHQYKLSKIQVINPMNSGEIIYERYKEIDAVFFDFLNKIEEFNANEVLYIEKFFFEYFLILGSNIKEVGRNSVNANKNLMTYKSKEFNLIYLNKQILQIIKDIIAQFCLGYNQNKDEKNLIEKIKRKLGNEYEKYKNENEINNNTNNILEENIITTKSEKINKINKSTNSSINLNINEVYNNNNNISKTKDILEFNYADFIQEFDLNKIFPKEISNNTIKEEIDDTIHENVNDNEINNDNDKNIINTKDINIQLQGDYSNVNEYSNLNLSKDNIELIKRTIITTATRANLISKTNTNTNTNMVTNRNTRSNTNLIGLNNNNDINNANIYGNYEFFNTETRNLKTEEEKDEYVEYNNPDPFKVDITSIHNNVNNIEISKEDSDLNLKSMLTKKEKNN